MCDNQYAVGLEWMNEAVAIARSPEPERPALWKAWDAEIDRIKRSRFGIATATFPILLMPVLPASGTAQSRYQSELGTMAILLAAERHRRKTGDWPASIDAIDRGILPKTPIDPYSGRAFLLERRDGRFLVHSIGPNLKDERGAYELRRSIQGRADDIGWGAWDVPLRRQPAPSE